MIIFISWESLPKYQIFFHSRYSLNSFYFQQGSFGVVYKATCEMVPYPIAVKVQEFPHINTEEQINILVEISVAKSFSHPNVVRFVGFGRTFYESTSERPTKNSVSGFI